MSQKLLATKSFEAAPSSWRLVTFALGLAAVLGFAASVSQVTALIPSRWIFAPWISHSSLQSVPAPIVFMAKIGVNLCLPASVLLFVFALLGFHRKLYAPRKRVAIWLTLAWLSYIAFVAMLFVLDAEFGGSDAAGAVGLVVGLISLPVIGLLGAFGILAAMSEFSALWRYDDPTPNRLPIAVIVWAIIPPILLVLPLWFAPSQPRAITARGNDEFEALCRTAGVRLLAKPAGPVRSIAFDWDPERMSRPFPCYTLDKRGNFTSGNLTCWAPKIIHKDGKNLVLDFIESRQDDYCHARSDVRMPYAHCPSVEANVKMKAPYYAIDTFTADVLAYYEVDRPDSKFNNLHHGPVRFQITLTDRRSGDVLGEMAYVVDQGNRRACGGNMGNEINQDAFIWDAIHRQ
jgi:hypothetical protein